MKQNYLTTRSRIILPHEANIIVPRKKKFDPFYPSGVRVGKACHDFLLHYHNFLDEDTEAQRGDITHASSHNILMVGHGLEAGSSHDTSLHNS